LRRLLGSLVLACLLVSPGPEARAEESADPANPAGSEGPGLDRLLQLPESMQFDMEKRGGATRSEWRGRFDEARRDQAKAVAALQEAKEKLSQLADGQGDWKFHPAGIGEAADADSQRSYALRQEIQRQESEKARAESRLRELDIQANLAGVPESWRGSVAAPTGGEEVVKSPGDFH
jgi:hypothetical protein